MSCFISMLLSKKWKTYLSALTLAASMFLPIIGHSHPSPNSLIFIDVSPGHVAMEVQIPLPELALVLGDEIQKIPEIFVEQYAAQLNSYLMAHVRAYANKNRPWQIKIKSMRVDKGTHVDSNIPYWELVVQFDLRPHADESSRRFTLQYDAVIHQVMNHVAYVSIRSDWETGMMPGDSTIIADVIGWNLTDNSIHPLEVNLEEGSWWNGFKGMFQFGMQHIREGLDHILFLLTLLLVAPLSITHNKWSHYQGFKYTLSRFLKISLAFTVGHSITLLAGSFNMFNFRVQYIEVLIAISILISSFNVIRPIFFRREIILAGVFGLIHGLAFSISLSHLDFNTGGKLISIMGFNLGIETMQLIIMVCFFPVLLVSKWKFYYPLRVAFAACTIIVSVAWIAERISNQENIITRYVNQLL